MLAVLGLVAGACSGAGTVDEAIAADELVALGGVEDLQTQFNVDAGTPRLILLVSPT